MENLNLLLPVSAGTLQLLLPLGLSFFTFQQIAFLVDRYRGEGSGRELAEGLWLFSLGLWKKVIVAQTFGEAVDWGFGEIAWLNSTTALLVALAYSFQLYFDFSGYTDMARGIGRMLGLHLPDNFNAPYQALTIGSFWKRWHMTMTRFFHPLRLPPPGGQPAGAGDHLPEHWAHLPPLRPVARGGLVLCALGRPAWGGHGA